MKRYYLIAAIAVMIISISLPMEGKRITMVPMSARDVYRVLRQAGREDAVPEGRIVTQGIAAVSGFALGIAKGIGGALLFDLLTANGTQQLLTGLLTGQTGATTQQVETQEICFNSRSLNDVYDGDDDDDVNSEGRQATITTTTPGATGGSPAYTSTTTPTNGGSGTTSVTPVTSEITQPTTTGTNTGTNTDTNVDTGTDSGTVTDTETQTGTGNAVNCVVIQKPAIG